MQEIVYNLNNCFGDISLVDLIQIENYKDKVASFTCNKDCLKHDFEDFQVLPTIPKPNSFRDLCMLRQHVETSRKNRG